MKTVVSTIVSAFFLMAIVAHTHAEAKQHRYKEAKNVVKKQAIQAKPQQVAGDCCQSCCENCLEPVYASGHSETLQTFSTAPFDFSPINFEMNVVPPVGILHPVSGDDTQFFFNEDGIYLIEWHMSLQGSVDPEAITTGHVLVQLRDLLTDTVISSSIVETDLNDQDFTPLAGQTLVELPGGAYIDLEISTFNSEISVVLATIVITRVSQ